MVNEVGKPGYEFCSLKSQYFIGRSNADTFTSYDNTFSSMKTFTAAEFGLTKIAGFKCDTQSNSLIIFGLDSSQAQVMQYVVLRGSTDRNADDRLIVFKSERASGQGIPNILNIQNNLVITELQGKLVQPAATTMNIDNVFVSVNTTAKTHPPVPKGSSYIITAKTFDQK